MKYYPVIPHYLDILVEDDVFNNDNKLIKFRVYDQVFGELIKDEITDLIITLRKIREDLDKEHGR